MSRLHHIVGAQDTRLSKVPAETLVAIILACLPEHVVGDEHRVEIAGLNRHVPVTLPFARTDQRTYQSVMNWLYGTYVFSFKTRSDERYFTSPHRQYAAEGLLAWFAQIGPTNAQRIRKLELSLTASELLLLFATPESRSLLQLPQDLHVWAQCSSALQVLELNELHVVLLPETCPGKCHFQRDAVSDQKVRPPAVGRWDLAGWKTDSSVKPDYRWMIKAIKQIFDTDRLGCAVRFSVDGGPAMTPVEVDKIRTSTWQMLREDTFGFKLCDQLAFPNERATTWASSDDEPIRPYRIPILAGSRPDQAWGSGSRTRVGVVSSQRCLHSRH